MAQYHKLVQISYNSQTAKFKIREASESAAIQQAIRYRFGIGRDASIVLVDQEDGTDVCIDGSLETGDYKLKVGGKSAPPCCPPGSLPATAPPADYKNKGKNEKWNGIPVYVSGNRESKTGKAIFIFPDAGGIQSGRTQQIADEWALSGYFCVIPDFFGTDPWSTERDWNTFPQWATKFTWDKIKSEFETILTHLEALGFSKFGAVGFCWGSTGVLQASATGKFSAGVSFHPSHAKIGEILKLENEAALVSGVRCPQLFCPAGNDLPSLKKGGLTDEIFSKKPFKNVIHEFPDMLHGWVNRGELTDPKIARDVRIAMDLATDWFNKHL